MFNHFVKCQWSGLKTVGWEYITKYLYLRLKKFAKSGKMHKKIPQTIPYIKIAGEQFQNVCNLSVKFHWYWLKTVGGFDITKLVPSFINFAEKLEVFKCSRNREKNIKTSVFQHLHNMCEMSFCSFNYLVLKLSQELNT